MLPLSLILLKRVQTIIGRNKGLYSCLKQTKISFFFFYKIGEQEGRTYSVWDEGVGTRRRGEDMEKGCRKVNMMQILCTHVCK
jgi:hypothetical protein